MRALLFAIVLFLAMPVGADALFVTQRTAPPLPTSCTDGVDCFCDNNPQYLHCVDFASDLNCQPPSGGFVGCDDGFSFRAYESPNHPVTYSEDPTNGWFSAGISTDTGALRMEITEQIEDNNASEINPFVTSGSITSGVIAVGHLIKAGPSFWSAYTHQGKWTTIKGTGDDTTNWVGYLRSVLASDPGACTKPYLVPTYPTSLGQGVQSLDEFGSPTASDNACNHTFRFSDDLVNKWIWIEWRYNVDTGYGEIYVEDEDRNTLTIGGDTGAGADRSGDVTINFYYTDASQVIPDADSFSYIDLIIADDANIGAPW